MGGVDQQKRTPGLYAGKVSREKQRDLAAAREMEGLGEEIAVLRVRLAELFGDERVDETVLLRAATVLVRAVATQYRLSPKARDDLAANIAAVLNSIGDQVFPVDR